jgi:gliding motility-associated-like protein
LGDSLVVNSAWTNQFAVDSLIYNLNGTKYAQKSPNTPNKKYFYSLPTGSYVLRTTVVDRFQCKQQDSVNIQVFANPAVDFSYNENTFDENNQQLVFFDHTPSAVSWNWNFEKLGNSNVQNPNLIVPINSKLKVHLMVTDAHGCMDSLAKELLVFHEIKFSFPSAITINGDGRNDIFKSYEKQWIEKLQLKIFNRWGEKVFETNDKNFEWSTSVSGTYVYQLSIKDINRKFEFLYLLLHQTRYEWG